MEGRKFTMGAKRPPRPVLHIKGPETVTQLAYDMQDVLTMSEPITPSSSSFSPGSSPPLPGSAVYALQSKVKAKSQRKVLEKECDEDDTKLLFAPRKRDEALSLSPMHRSELDMPGSSDEEGMDQVQRGVFASEPSVLVEQRALAAAESEGGRESPFLSVAGQTRGLGEGASLESLLTDGSGDLQGDGLTSRTSSTMPSSSPPSSSSSSSSSRPWAPPKGFWRVARPETLVLDGENASKEMPPPGAEGSQGKPKMKVGGVDLDSYGQLHHSDSLESHLRRCWKQEAHAAESFEGLWRADSLENVAPLERTPSLCERMERSQRALRQVQMLRRHHAKGPEVTTVDLDVHHSQDDDVRGTESMGMLNEGESDLVYTVSPYEFEQIYRCIVTSDDLPLSPRHEKAKRLLERARLKARSQLPKGEQPVRTGPGKVPEHVSASPLFHKAVQVAQEKANSRDLQPGPLQPGPPLQHKAVAVQVASQEEPCRDVPSGSPTLHKAVMAASQDNICREVPLGSPPLHKAVLVAAPEEICRDQPTVSPSLHKAVMVAAQDEICRELPTGSPPLHKAVLVTAQEEIAIAPIKLVDVRGRECERGTRSRRVGQSPTRVRFEDESEREAERRYLERVRQRGPVVTDKSQNAATKPEQSRGVSTRKEDEGIANQVIIPQEEVVGKCDACGSLLGIIIAKDAHGQPVLSAADGRGKLVPKWVPPGPADQQQSFDAGDADLAAMAALAESMGGAGEGGAGEGGAGEQMSGFGKLRRRSLKGERRDEAGHVLGPYARSQDLWAQRRNSYSKMRAGMEEAGLLYTQSMPMPPQGVTFSLDAQSMLARMPAGGASGSGILKDTSSPQLPLKSALKSSSKNQAGGQRVVTLLPSVQYRLVHLDQEKEGKPHHIELSADEQLTVMAGTSSTGLTPCIKSSLRYTTAKMTSDLPSQGLWDTSSEAVTAHLGGEELTGACAAGGSLECRPALRGGAGSKADDLRSELLRAEHRKAELMWEDMPESASRAMMAVDGKSKLSLRRFFSAMGLNSMGKLVKGNRSSSMDHLCSPSVRHIAPISASASPSPSHRPRTRLQRTPSLQSLHTESPQAQLRKVSSVQSLQSPKRLKERSTILGAVPYNLAPREFDQDPCLGDPEVPRGPQGRLVQAYPDGTLHIELSRPANGPFGFVISRGKGRPGSGVFVDQVGDSSADSIYTGLLGVGDEILQVNGEMVAGLSMEQVTRLMTRDSTASIRIIPHRWIQS